MVKNPQTYAAVEQLAESLGIQYTSARLIIEGGFDDLIERHRRRAVECDDAEMDVAADVWRDTMQHWIHTRNRFLTDLMQGEE